MNGETGRILFMKNANQLHYPASLIKMVTCILAIEKSNGQFDLPITASMEALRSMHAGERQKDCTKYPKYILEHDMSHMGLKVGERIPLRDLLYGLMLASACDAANVLAEHFGNQSIDTFVAEENALMRAVGCTHTTLYNPSGLFYPGQFTTALDMARIATYAMKNETFREIVKSTQYEKKATNKQPATTITTVNRLIKRGSFYYPYAIGIKTGYTEKAQHNIVAAAEKDGRRLILVLLHCNNRRVLFSDARKTFEKAFEERQVEKVIAYPGIQHLEKKFHNSYDTLTTYTTEKLRVQFYPSEAPTLHCTLEWEQLKLPIQRGQKVGMLRLLDDTTTIAEVALYAQNDVHKHITAAIRATLAKVTMTQWLCLFAIAAGLTLFCVIRRKRLFR